MTMTAIDISRSHNTEKTAESYYREENEEDPDSDINRSIPDGRLGIGDQFIFPILDQYGIVRATEMARVLKYLPKRKLWQLDMIEFEIIREHLDDVPRAVTMSVFELTMIIQWSGSRYEFRRPSDPKVREILAEERRKQLVVVD